jgi:hypothetical protein
MLADYEQMRGTVLDPLSKGMGTLQGVALFLRHGMAAWMGAWSNCMSQSPHEPDRASTRTSPPLPQSIQAQLAMILAGMILSQHREITT